MVTAISKTLRNARVTLGRLLAFQLLVALLSPVMAADPVARNAAARAFTEADAIEMTSLGDPDYWHHNQSLGRVANYSPDGAELVVVLRRGNLSEGVTEYSLLRYRSKDLLRTPAPQPDVLLRMPSASNREAFVSLKWLPDSRTLLFMGERPGEERQVFSLDIATRALKQLTQSATGVLNYSASADSASILYLADKPESPIWTTETRRHGIVVSDQQLTDLIAGRQLPIHNRGDLYLLSAATGQPRQIELKSALDGGFTPAISPDGRHALIRVFANPVPRKWHEYTDPILQSALPKEPLAQGQVSAITQFIVIDLQTGAVRAALDAPQPYTDGGVDAKWAADSTSILISLLYMPLDGVSAQERQRRASGPFTAELDLSGSARPLAPESLLEMARIERWEHSTNIATLIRQSAQGIQRTFFQKRRNGWRGISAPRGWRDPVSIVLKEGMNLPPALVVRDPGTHTERTLLDLNPQLQELKLARQEEIEWQATDGTRVRGGLYYPPDYVSGRRYPLVIQTHGWNPALFAVDGIFVSAFAAQALANKDIMVLQAWDFPTQDNADAWQKWLQTKMGKVAQHQLEQAIYEGAIDHLDSAGLIDRNKVGIIGFSYTCWSVKYALSHPHAGYRFAAAAVSDGFDGGYFDYIVHGNNPKFAQQFESAAGGKPYGPGLQAWLKEAPGFNIDRVDTPLRMLPLGNPQSLLSDWEWFTLLRRMNKPAELVMIENGTHTLVKPWDRMVVSGGNVDWFDFWLNDRKDPTEAKTEQYARWEKMRPEGRFR